MPVPVPLTPLLGRTHELEEITALLARTRLLTITGAGGSGKTRLALELANRLTAAGERTVWVDLAPVVESEQIAEQILTALGQPEPATRDTLQAVLDTISDKSMVLVLDNCEHVIDGCARIAETILRHCAKTSIVATTREALGIVGEQTWLVPPLAADDAMQLFADRARAVLPSFAVEESGRAAIAQICERLDGIPLSIELAAARVKVLTIQQIHDLLDDVFRLLSSGSRTVPRHRTIRETIDWSFRLLGEPEQILLRRVSVFLGGFSLADAEEVCSDPLIKRSAIFELLSALVDKSLALFDGTRYRLLETVRQFAAEKLDEAGESARLRESHARYYMTLVEAAEPQLFGGASDAATMARIDEEIANIRSVLDWSVDDPSRAELEMRIIYAIHWYWFARGHFHEATRRIAEAIARAESVSPAVRARLLVAAGDSAVWQARWSDLHPLLQPAVDILRNDPDLRARAVALMLLATGYAFGEGNHDAAQRTFAGAIEAARENGRDVALALVLYWAGMAAQLRDDWRGAYVAFQEAHQIGVAIGSKPGIAHPLTVLGFVALRHDDLDEALRCFAEALDIHAEIDDRWGLTQAIEGIAAVLLERGDGETGTRLAAFTSAAWLRLGARPARPDPFEMRMRATLRDEKLRVALASGAAMSYEQAVAIARDSARRMLASVDGTGTAKAALTVRALGPLQIVRDDAELDSAASSGRSRELLVYLLTQPSGATKEQIGAALWPDADASKLRNNFHVTMHRLRKILGGAEWVVAQGDRYNVDRARGVEFDAETFEREVKAALRMMGKKADAASRLGRAIELYRGDFLANVAAGEWADEIRERLRHLYAGALSALGRTRMENGDARGAAEVYEKLLAFDAIDEEAARGLMLSLAKQGDRSGASRTYKRLADSLRRQLDAEPEPRTVKLHDDLTRGAS